MDKPYQLALHIFRRDLRLHDNSALIEALRQAEQVVPCFIFDPRQIEPHAYQSRRCLQFMLNSLQELDQELVAKQSRLFCFYGEAETVLDDLLQNTPIEAVFINRDYTPFSRLRDSRIANVCDQKNISFQCFSDTLLHEPEQLLKPDKTPYTIYSHAFNRASSLSVTEPIKNTYSHYYNKPIQGEDPTLLHRFEQSSNLCLAIKGGRHEARQLITHLASLENYPSLRDFPAKSGTTRLSAHNKFGTISIRELYYAIAKRYGTAHTLIKELYWRDFFTHIGFHFPRVFGENFQSKYNAIHWNKPDNTFERWCNGLTGFPIVDAGMRELNKTGYMHNRVRMIVASFLCKDLHIDWREGERYFAQTLIDYDPCVNNGNWQWAASTGCDAQPFFRIFNPWLQQKKFDPEGIYIKKWVTELQDIPAATLHDLYKSQVPHYPSPIVNHAQAAAEAKIRYRRCAAN